MEESSHSIAVSFVNRTIKADDTEFVSWDRLRTLLDSKLGYTSDEIVGLGVGKDGIRVYFEDHSDQD